MQAGDGTFVVTLIYVCLTAAESCLRWRDAGDEASDAGTGDRVPNLLDLK